MKIEYLWHCLFCGSSCEQLQNGFVNILINGTQPVVLRWILINKGEDLEKLAAKPGTLLLLYYFTSTNVINITQ